MAKSYLDAHGHVARHDQLGGLSDEGDAGPGENGNDRYGPDDEEQAPHLGHGDAVEASVALGEEGMTVWIVPVGQGPVKHFTSAREVQELHDRVGEEEDRDRVRGQLVHLVLVLDHVDDHEGELHQDQTQVDLANALVRLGS